ncbi:Insulin-degrading enzyme-like Protein [Tribolium castaneum]|uniref:Insulin-degrading enzyme-like Protein n=2 Tax=Tribolium castaneum TaxID=7070 RepID=D6WHA9_TRICA|nr:PREDICTED: nardilysin isoform X1 [Tribolium castaneum]EFA00999.2 Insulin-degrading enzyme-like Protein [Tribolium castaneum]|eukprot:XP_015834095.1 PREDICTED: nardilysin isoform X1 [Tribolium castaneum]
MAAASLCIGVGSFSDPKTVPGMAHFLEHMVFMGSEKFPEENDFDSFISKRGGSDNASTDCEYTTFYFECLEKDLLTALDKFAQFFISPLMKRCSITREREAIESEFQMALPSDTYRKEQLLASLADDKSPVNTFTWGNLITLRDNVSEDDLYKGVHEFRKRHYSAHRMTLAIQARLPMDELEKYVLECFSNVPSNDLPPDDFKQFTNVFDTPKFTKMYYIQPVNEVIQLELTWALPSLLNKYKSKPHQYVSWILGDEGKGSLLAYLKKKVWVLSISAGNGESGSEHNSLYAFFTISMSLTEEGFKHLNEVIEIVFSYINMLKKLGPQERLYNEMKIIGDISFKFATEETAVELVESLSEDMHLYPPEDYITGSELFFEYDPDAIKMVLNSLVPEKMNVIALCNKLPAGLTFDQTEKWFGTKYTEKDIPNEWLKKWQKATPLKEFSLPAPNQFLTENFTILDEEENHAEYPEKILSTPLVEVWYRKDQKFKLPIAYYNFYFINPMGLDVPKTAALADFYMTLIQIQLVDEAYPATVAQLSYSFKCYDKGIVVGVSGYNEKLHVLIELITKYMLNFNSNLTEDMFKAVKNKLIKYYYNCLLKPTSLAKDVRLDILVDNYNSLVDKYNVTHSLTFDDLKKFAESFIQNLFIMVLIQGNVTKEHAINVVNNLVTSLNCKPIDPHSYPKFRVGQIPNGENYCVLESFNTNDSNSVVTNYYQSGPFSVKNSVIIEILMLIIQEPLFDTLRTKEQLGYDVSCSNRDTFGILGFSITVNAQATKNTTEHVQKRIEAFIQQASDLLKCMTEEAFETTKHDLIKTKRCVDVHLKEEFNRNWSEIADEDYMFDRLKQEIAEIEKLTLGEVQKWWQAHTLCGSKENFRKLSIQVAGFSDGGTKPETSGDEEKKEGMQLAIKFIEDNKVQYDAEAPNFITSVATFKQNLFLFPLVGKNKIENN